VYGRKVLRSSTVVGAFPLSYVFIRDYITVIYFNSVVVILNTGSTTARVTMGKTKYFWRIHRRTIPPPESGIV